MLGLANTRDNVISQTPTATMYETHIDTSMPRTAQLPWKTNTKTKKEDDPSKA